MSQKYDTAYKFTAKWEGALSDDAADRGGLTHWGVSTVFLTDFAKSYPETCKALGVNPLPVSRQTIKNLTKEQAKAIFKKAFWDKLQLDDMPIQMGVLLYDCAVNSGISQSVRLAQRGYNKASGQSIAVDGKYGPITRSSLLQGNNETTWEAIIEARKNFYHQIVDRRESQRVFLKGWLNRANDLIKYVKTLEA